MRPFYFRLFTGLFLSLVLNSNIANAANVAVCDEASLRAALAPDGTVTFACDGTIVLSNTLSVTGNITIDASGRSVTLSGNDSVRIFHVASNATLRLIHLTLAQGRSSFGGAVFNEGTLVLDQCQVNTNTAQGLAGTNGIAGTNGPTVAYGMALSPGEPGSNAGPGASASGGAIFNVGNLVATNTVFSGNRSQGGSGGAGGNGGRGGQAIDQFGRTFNSSNGGDGGLAGIGGDGFGGAIFNLGTAILRRVAFFGNIAEGGRGGLGGAAGNEGWSGSLPGQSAVGGLGGAGRGGGWFNAGMLDVSESAGVNDRAVGGRGGDGTGVIGLTIRPGTGGNGGQGQGGLGFNRGTNRLVQITASANEARGGDSGFGGIKNTAGCPELGGNGGNGAGGALYDLGDALILGTTLWSNTVSGGIATNRGGAGCTVFHRSLLGTNGLAFGSAVVSSNALAVRASILGGPNSTNSCAGVIADGGHNLCSDGTAGFTQATSRANIDPRLTPIELVGPDARFVLIPRRDSPATDAGDDSTGLLTDQRGVPRPQGAHADIGAVEAAFLTIHQITPSTVQLRYAGVPGSICSLEGADSPSGSWNLIESRAVNLQGQVIFGDLPITPRLYQFFRVAESAP